MKLTVDPGNDITVDKLVDILRLFNGESIVKIYQEGVGFVGIDTIESKGMTIEIS